MKTKKISIFIAGATILKKERMAFKAIANDLNGELEQKGVHVTIRSYENFRESQEDYDNFIENKADLVVFVIDGKIGEETKNEFLLASKKQQETGRPRIIVFLREFDEMTPDIAFIRGLLSVTTNEYWIQYRDEEDLVHKAEKRLRKFIGDFEPQRQKPKFRLPTISKRVVLWFVAALLLVGAAWFVYDKFIRKDPIIILVGGGSAANYVEKNTAYKFRKFKDCFYVDMPSENSWQMMSDEIFRALRTDPDERRFYPILVSASVATDSSFLRKIDEKTFTERGSVVSYHMGNDSLAVYVSINNDSINKWLGNQEKITPQLLIDCVKKAAPNKVGVFVTSPGSGTYRSYENLLQTIDQRFVISDSIEEKLFADSSPIEYLNRGNEWSFIILGSEYYYPKVLDKPDITKNIKKLTMVDVNGNPVLKPINLYFMAYKKSEAEGSPYLVLQKPVKKALEAMGVKDIKTKVKNGRIKTTSDKVLIDYESLSNW